MHRTLASAAWQTLEGISCKPDDSPLRPVVVSDCGVLPGWHKPPLPLPDASKDGARTVKGLSEQAQERRSAVAEAVQMALTAKRGAVELDPPSAKQQRAASEVGGASKRLGGMMALPFEDELGGDSDGDDES